MAVGRIGRVGEVRDDSGGDIDDIVEKHWQGLQAMETR